MKGEHYLKLLLGSDTPIMIDGMLTPSGKNFTDFWLEYGEAMAATFRNKE